MRRLRKLGFLAMLFVACMLGTTEIEAKENPAILNGVSIGAVDVSGMTSEEAKAAVNQHIEKLRADEITFHMNGNTYAASVESFGYAWANEHVVEDAVKYGKDGNIIQKYKQKCDLEQTPASLALETKIDEALVMSIIDENCSQYNQAVVEYGIATEDGKPMVVGGRAGVKLDLEKSKVTVANYLTKEWVGGDGDVDLDVEITQPKPIKEELEKITDILGAGSTTYGYSSASRKINVENGTAKVHGTILYPGDSFSMLEACAPFNKENGYEKAGSYESGTVVDSYGGGICQVSTTLYLAVMRSELQIDKRSNHSMLVSYVKPSMDAAIADGLKDFVFTNNTDAPVYIEGTADGWEVAFTIYGKDTRPENREVRFVSETLSNNDPAIELKAKLWKIVTIDGEETKIEFNRSTYYKKKEETIEDPEGTGEYSEESQVSNNSSNNTQDESYEDSDDDDEDSSNTESSEPVETPDTSEN